MIIITMEGFVVSAPVLWLFFEVWRGEGNYFDIPKVCYGRCEKRQQAQLRERLTFVREKYWPRT